MLSKNMLWTSLAAVALFVAPLLAAPMSTEFTFQGQLKQNGAPMNGSVGIRATLWDAASGGAPVGTTTVENLGVSVVNGLLTFPLDFPVADLNGEARWLQIEIDGGSGYTPMSTRQALTAAPYALQTRGIVVDDADKVGIGTTSPSQKLDVNGTINGTNFLKNGVAFGVSPWSESGSDISFSGGNVGIGTGSPGAKLDVRSSPAEVGIFSGDLEPFGAAQFETNVSNTSTHAWFAENGVRVFSVTTGGVTTTKILTILGGSDIAEPFDFEDESKVLPGMVVAIDPARTGKLRIANEPYDATVAGIVSGAGGINPGITLTQDGTVADGEHLVALTGRVYCYCDADAAGSIKPGDMLTTSGTPGHAMKATDRTRAYGAVIGKAMSSLDSGKGLVLVLVNLQ